MKGILFNELEVMVRDRLGRDAWEDVLDATKLQTEGGVFAGPKVYPDTDFFALVATVSEMTHTPIGELTVQFGRHLFPRLVARYPMFVAPGMTAKALLKTVHDTIHVEVRKLHQDAILPMFDYEDPAPDRLVMIYTSSRQACDLAVGLIAGVGEHFHETITQEQVLCTKRGARHCRFELTFSPSQ